MAKRQIGPGTENHIIERVREVREIDGSRTPSMNIDLDHLFEMHRSKIHTLCLQMMDDPVLADEMVQETLVQAWRKLPEFDGRVRFRYWIYGIARNLCRNARRKSQELLTEDGVLEATGLAASALSTLRTQERSMILHEAALAVLDKQEQEAVHLRYVEGMSIKQITEVLELSGSGARGLLQRCRRKLGVELQVRLDNLGHGRSLFQQSIDT